MPGEAAGASERPHRSGDDRGACRPVSLPEFCDSGAQRNAAIFARPYHCLCPAMGFKLNIVHLAVISEENWDKLAEVNARDLGRM